jgi:hypothetical protein
MKSSNESAVSGAIATQGVCQTPSLYQNQTLFHQLNQQPIQQIQPIIHIERKHKSSRHFTPKQHTIMQQPGRWTPRRRLQLVQRWRYQRKWTTDRTETEWQTVSHKRERIKQTPWPLARKRTQYHQQVWITLLHALLWWRNRKCLWNRYSQWEKEDPKSPSPPIYIRGVTDYKAMVANLVKVVDGETYFTKTLSNSTVRISSLTSET